jgi:hypothetical protein
VPGERQPNRRPRTTSRPGERPIESWEADLDPSNGWEEKPPRSGRTRPSTRPESSDQETTPRPRKRRPPSQDRVSSPPPKEVESTPTDYVDYQPIDPSEEESDHPGRFDY